MASTLDGERKAHERTKRALEAAQRNREVIAQSWTRDTAELFEARRTLDRAAVDLGRARDRVRRLEDENAALRNQVAVLALAAGGGASL